MAQNSHSGTPADDHDAQNSSPASPGPSDQETQTSQDETANISPPQNPYATREPEPLQGPSVTAQAVDASTMTELFPPAHTSSSILAPTTIATKSLPFNIADSIIEFPEVPRYSKSNPLFGKAEDKDKGKEVRNNGIMSIPFGPSKPPTNIRTEYIATDIFVDLFLVVGADSKAIRFAVTAGVLGGQSEPFAAMCRHKFAERTQFLSISQGGEPGEIWLPDDDPDGTRILLQLLHNRNFGRRGSFQEPNLTMVEIENLAILCDKYQVVGALRPWVSKWLSSEDLTNEFEDMVKRLCLAYAYDDHKNFSDASYMILWKYDENEIIQIKVDEAHFKTLLAILPEDFFSVLNETRRSSIREFQDKVEEAVCCSSILNDESSCSEDLPFHLIRMACDRDAKVAHIFQELYRAGLFPLSKIHQYHSLTRLTSMVDDIQNYQYDSLCNCSSVNFKETFKYIIEKYKEEVRGLCVTCVKANRFSAEEGNCRGKDKCEFHPGESNNYAFSTATGGNYAANHGRGFFADQGARNDRGGEYDGHSGGRGYHGASGSGGRHQNRGQGSQGGTTEEHDSAMGDQDSDTAGPASGRGRGGNGNGRGSWRGFWRGGPSEGSRGRGGEHGRGRGRRRG